MTSGGFISENAAALHRYSIVNKAFLQRNLDQSHPKERLLGRAISRIEYYEFREHSFGFRLCFNGMSRSRTPLWLLKQVSARCTATMAVNILHEAEVLKMSLHVSIGPLWHYGG